MCVCMSACLSVCLSRRDTTKTCHNLSVSVVLSVCLYVRTYAHSACMCLCVCGAGADLAAANVLQRHLLPQASQARQQHRSCGGVCRRLRSWCGRGRRAGASRASCRCGSHCGGDWRGRLARCVSMGSGKALKRESGGGREGLERGGEGLTARRVRPILRIVLSWTGSGAGSTGARVRG